MGDAREVSDALVRKADALDSLGLGECEQAVGVLVDSVPQHVVTERAVGEEGGIDGEHVFRQLRRRVAVDAVELPLLVVGQGVQVGGGDVEGVAFRRIRGRIAEGEAGVGRGKGGGQRGYECVDGLVVQSAVGAVERGELRVLREVGGHQPRVVAAVERRQLQVLREVGLYSRRQAAVAAVQGLQVREEFYALQAGDVVVGEVDGRHGFHLLPAQHAIVVGVELLHVVTEILAGEVGVVFILDFHIPRHNLLLLSAVGAIGIPALHLGLLNVVVGVFIALGASSIEQGNTTSCWADLFWQRSDDVVHGLLLDLVAVDAELVQLCAPREVQRGQAVVLGPHRPQVCASGDAQCPQGVVLALNRIQRRDIISIEG